MDSMNFKHKEVFAKTFMEVFKVHENKEVIQNEWNRYNLYSMTRGINRFYGLEDILLFCKEHYGITIEDEQIFFDWLKNAKSKSAKSIKEYMETNGESKCLSLAYKWSLASDQKINNYTTHIFPGVKDALVKLSEVADLCGVSSAVKTTVEAEWKREGIYDYFVSLGCQEDGSKKSIINKMLSKGYLPENCIMLGDAPGDYDAAKDCEIMFFPIIPDKESECWQMFCSKVINDFLNRQFNSSNNQYLSSFLSSLHSRS